MRHASLLAVAVALGGLVAAGASAETLYKLIDKNGKVTYAEKPPKDYDGKVIRLDIDTSANTSSAPKPAAQAPTRNEEVIRGRSGTEGEARVKAARDKLESTRKAYADARDHPGEADVQRVGTKGGFTRPVFSEEYQRKLDKLEADVKQAEQELDRAEHGR